MSDTNDAVARAITGKRVGPSGWTRGHCPLCVLRVGRADRHMSLGVEARTRRFHCFRCSASGVLDGGEARGPSAPAEPAKPRDPPKSYAPLYDEPGLSARSLDAARAYVRGRGLDDATAREAQIGGCGAGPFAGRVIVPIIDELGRWLWYVGRAWGPAEKTYLYPVGSRAGLLYNASALRVETDVPLLVVEGAFDALAHWPDACAVLGKPTGLHLDLLAAASRPVCIVLDGDANDEARMCAYELHMRGHTRVGMIQLGPRVDPDEIPRDTLSRLAMEACAHP